MKKIERSVKIFAIMYFSLVIANLILGFCVDEDNFLYITLSVIIFNPVSIICGVASVAFLFQNWERKFKKLEIN